MNISFSGFRVKTRRKKFGIGSLLFSLIIGGAFIAVGLAIFQSTKIDPSWVKVQGTVVGSTSSIDTTNNGSSTVYTPIIKYQVGQQSYKVASSSGSSSYPVNGSSKQIAYNPNNPQQAKVITGTGTKLLLMLFPIIGILLIIISFFAFVRSLRRSKDINSLKQTGQKLQGVIVDIQTNTINTSQQNSSYKIIVAAADSTGATHNFVSDSLTGLGGLAMADYRNQPIAIDVYINPTNPNDYYVDVSEVPNLTPDRIAELIRQAASHRSFADTGTINNIQTTQPVQPTPVTTLTPQIPTTPNPLPPEQQPPS